MRKNSVAVILLAICPLLTAQQPQQTPDPEPASQATPAAQQAAPAAACTSARKWNNWETHRLRLLPLPLPAHPHVQVTDPSAESATLQWLVLQDQPARAHRGVPAIF